MAVLAVLLSRHTSLVLLTVCSDLCFLFLLLGFFNSFYSLGSPALIRGTAKKTSLFWRAQAGWTDGSSFS